MQFLLGGVLSEIQTLFGFSRQEIKSWRMTLVGALGTGVWEIGRAGPATGRKGGKNHSHGFRPDWLSLGQLLFSCTQNLTPLESPKRGLPALGMLYIALLPLCEAKLLSREWLSQTTGSLVISVGPSCVPQWCSLGPPKALWNGLSLLSCKIKWISVWIRSFPALDQSFHCSGSRPLSE